MTLTLGPMTIHSYTLFIALAALAVGGRVLWLAPARRRGAYADALLVALAGGLIVGRALHVALHWGHFAYYTDEIWQLRAGGLDWHGAFLGAWGGWLVGARWRGLTDWKSDAFAPSVPLVAVGAWCGCALAHCAYGAEVATLAAYPSYLVWEGADIYGIVAPRFNVQGLGALLSAGLWALMCLLGWRGLFSGRRLALSVLLFSFMMWALGFLRADYSLVWGGLRADQWLDALGMGGSLAAIAYRVGWKKVS